MSETVAEETLLFGVEPVPAMTGYPTVDQLKDRLESLRAEHPELITAERIGTTRLGEPLWLYTLGEGRLSGLLAGGVHPNEPIGSVTILHLVQQLASSADLRARLDTTWRIIPCADPDGMRLNEGWFQDPGDAETYFRHFYRPAGDEQVEWTFPLSYKRAHFDAMLPETQALQRAIDLARPDFYVPLHNAESGGAYYYLSEPMPELCSALQQLPERFGVPLHRGEPEAAHFTELAPGIFDMGTVEEIYDWLEGLGLDPAPPGSAGDASTSYARRYGTLSMIAELPLQRHPDADDLSLSEHRYADLLEQEGAQLIADGERLLAMLAQAEPELSLETPMLRASRCFLPMVRRSGESHRARAGQEENSRSATVSELTGLPGVRHMLRLRFGGIFLRALEAEFSAGTASASLRRLADEMEGLFAQWLREAAACPSGQTQAIPAHDVASVQCGAVLALADYAGRHRG
ncbi:M14 family zinc carboxypeptidase [Nesterenkonia cremea]|uniref:M14 family zinc carboxypeptidase n=1 Tax=Nesterenkonia cremea TaxID=1882340 RepID=UPI0016664037|nr:M14 family zinc carboxypeptidase [Nesterenkonia cremea]